MTDPRKMVMLDTGGAGMTAAITAHDAGASVQLFERADKVGGTTAWSGGMVWIPNNHLEQQAGVADSRDEAVTYLMSMSHGLIEQHMAEAFVDAGPLMVRHLFHRAQAGQASSSPDQEVTDLGPLRAHPGAVPHDRTLSRLSR